PGREGTTPADRNRTASARFKGWPGVETVVAPQRRWGEVTMELLVELPHRDHIERDAIIGATGVDHGRSRKRIGEPGQRSTSALPGSRSDYKPRQAKSTNGGCTTDGSTHNLQEGPPCKVG